MKKLSIKPLILPLIIAFAALVASSTSASAQFVGTAGIDFSETGTANYAGTGQLGETFTAVQGGTVVQSAKAVGSTGLSLAISDPNATGNNDYYGNTGSNGTISLFNNFIAEQNNTTVGLVFTLSGLKVGDTYEVAVYAGPNGNFGGQTPVSVTLNGTSIGTANPQGGTSTPANSFQLGVNYVTGFATADSNGDITIQNSNGKGSNYVLTNGIGITDTSVPEPGTWAMLLAGVGALLGIQSFRRRNA